MYENAAFIERVIRKLQSVDRGNDRFVAILTRYLLDRKRILYDDARDLFLVQLPDGTFQVAIWMMKFY